MCIFCFEALFLFRLSGPSDIRPSVYKPSPKTALIQRCISLGVEPIKYSAAFLIIRCRQSHTGADELTAISMLKKAKRYSAILSQLQMQLTFSYLAGNSKEMLSGG